MLAPVGSELELRRATPWSKLWLPVLAGVLPVLAVAGFELVHVGQAGTPDADWALIATDAERALHLDLAVGPYSRFGFHHPGPALAYWLAPFWWASGRHYGGLALGAAVLGAVILATMVAAAGRAAGARAAWATAAVAVLFSFTYGLGRLPEPWNPAAAILPLAAVGVVGAALAAGRRWFLPVWAALATLALQAHVGSTVVLAAVVLAPLVVGVVAERHRLGRWLAPAGVAVVVLAGLWIPPLAQQADPPPGRDGNLTQIYDFVTDGPTPQQTWQEVRGPLEVLAPLTVPHFGSLLGGTARGVLDPRPVDDVVLVVLAAGLVAAAVAGSRGRSPFHLALGAAGLLAVPATIVAAFRVVGPIYPYLAFPAVSAGLLAWIATASTAAEWGPAVIDRLRRSLAGSGPRGRHARGRARHRAAHRAPGEVSPARTALRRAPAALVVVASLVIATGCRDLVPAATERSSPVSAHLGAEAVPILRSRHVHRVLLDMNQLQWEIGSGVARYLSARGFEVTVVGTWRSTFGDGSRRTGREQARLVVTPTGVAYPTRDGDRVVASYAGRSLWLGRP